MPDHDEREAQILHTATAVIIRQGYNKTTMSDIADEVGVSRGTVYLYFKGKEELFEALLYWEWTQYSHIWLEALESDPRGGTMGGFYRALFHAVSSRPLMAPCCDEIGTCSAPICASQTPCLTRWPLLQAPSI